jgi:hypothetical protein
MFCVSKDETLNQHTRIHPYSTEDGVVEVAGRQVVDTGENSRSLTRCLLVDEDNPLLEEDLDS